MRVLITIAVLLMPAPAFAYCIERMGFDFDGKLNARLEYLVCMINEQSDIINQHASLLDQQRSTIRSLELQVSNGNSEVRSLKISVDDLMRKLSAAETELVSMSTRIDTLD